jgi:hypothetical protein
MTMGFVELTDGPDGLRTQAAQFSGAAEEFAGRAQALLDQIAAVEATSPWGNDSYAKAFRQSYSQPTEQGPLHEAVDAEARGLGPEATEIATALSDGATDYQTGDLQAADDIGSVQTSGVTAPAVRSHV